MRLGQLCGEGLSRCERRRVRLCVAVLIQVCYKLFRHDAQIESDIERCEWCDACDGPVW